MSLRILAVLLFLVSPSSARQSDSAVGLLSAAQMEEDTAILVAAMTQLHPGLFLHNTPEQLQGHVATLGQQAAELADTHADAVPMPEFYLAVARAVAAIKDGHTQVSMYNQSQSLASVLYDRADRVPFTFRLVGDRMVVTGDATPNEVLPRGTEILTLDGRPVADVIRALMPFAAADGSNDAKRLDELQVSAASAPAERFDVIYSLLFQPEGKLRLTAKPPGEAPTSMEVSRMTQDARREILLSRDDTLPRSKDDLFRWRMLDDRTAYIYIGSFATFSLTLDYPAWISETFQAIRDSGAENLVVDLRDVAGGMDDAAALLLRHLIQEPVAIDLWQGHTAYQRMPDALRPHVNSWSNAYLNWTGQVSEADGRFKLPPRPDITLAPAEDAFDGRGAVLVDATASSATFYLAKAIKEAGAAPLIGQETGGSLKGLNAGQMVFLTLPNSGIVVDLPLIGSRPAEPGPDQGVEPDVWVRPTVEAIAAGQDLEMEAALAWFAGRN